MKELHSLGRGQYYHHPHGNIVYLDDSKDSNWKTWQVPNENAYINSSSQQTVIINGEENYMHRAW